MVWIFRLSLIYLVFAIALTAVLTGDLAETLTWMLYVAGDNARTMWRMALYAAPLILLGVMIWGRRQVGRRLANVILIAVSSIILQIGFVVAKSAIPRLAPFYADPYLARIDHGLLFGYDAWQLAHALVNNAIVETFPFFYIIIWSVVAVALPVVIVATDPDEARAKRYCCLFMLAWIVVGNVFAVAFSSVGPVFYDRLLGVDRFADLAIALKQSGFADGALGQLQDALWNVTSDVNVPISSISAYPSVHVAVATVLMLYMRERMPRVAFLGYAFLGVIAFISVYSGYHYFVGSLSGFAIVVGLKRMLYRLGADFATRPRAADADRGPLIVTP